ncbi:hypothetical protein L3Q65_45850 [Amycolatopsis sp. FU40]|nr:hypothetical protein [Amycolatopsis sp. FU40]UKD55099.1 hypothetical protein L3Q65_45850 [Amycolatopsis sp. FU40]
MRTRAGAVVATWPPLTEHQRDRLAALLTPMRSGIARQAAARSIAA